MGISAASIRFQDYQFSVQSVSGIWRWTTRVDVTGPVPAYQVKDIRTPFGLFRDNGGFRDSIPIPGDVIQAMSDSIVQLQQNFPPKILIGPPSSLIFEADEGRGFTAPQAVVLTNDGVFGSLLGAALATSAPFVTVTPANVGNLASNETGSFSVAVDSTNLLAANSPYSEQVTVQDPNASNTPQVLPVTINVRPKATISISPLQLNFSVSRPLTGPFPILPSQQFTIRNTGLAASLLSYQIQRLTNLSNDWLTSYAPVAADIAGGQSQIIAVNVAPIDGLSSGTYQETLRVSGYSTNSFVDVLIQLVIS